MKIEAPALAVTCFRFSITVYVVVTLFFVAMIGGFGLAARQMPPSAGWLTFAFVIAVLGSCWYTCMLEMVTRVVVGADGVMIKQLNRGRFLAFSAIAELVDEPDRLTFVLRPAGREVITTNRASQAFRRRYVARIGAIVERVRQGLVAHPGELVPAPPHDALWLRVRAQLIDGASSVAAYRDTEIPDGVALRALVADAAAPLQTRAAAAVALRDDEDARAPLADLAATTASPSLAALLSAVSARADATRLLAALDEVGHDDHESPVSGS